MADAEEGKESGCGDSIMSSLGCLSTLDSLDEADSDDSDCSCITLGEHFAERSYCDPMDFTGIFQFHYLYEATSITL